jgi:Secretion system C-terminal sorting domain/FG-GAP-like repeat
MHLLFALSLLLPQAIEIQTDWISGPGTLGPVGTWNSAFYQSESINYNISDQISLVSTTIPGGWTKHIIQTVNQIIGQDGLYPADFDGDGDLDLAAWMGGTSFSNKLRIYKNQKVETGIADFTVQTTITLPNGSSYYGILWCGDLDNDGDADVVVPCTPGPKWFENTGSFNFTSHDIGSRTYNRASCDVGDVDNDGDKDIVIIGVSGNSGSTGPLDLWRNGGSMNFTRQNITTSGNWWRVMLADLNNDNYLDIFNSGNVYLNSSGNFSGSPSWTVPDAQDIDGIWIRDFNNDGNKDLLVGFQWADVPAMAWFENSGSGTSYVEHLIATGDTAYDHSDACIGEDLDLDGKPDVVGTYEQVGFFHQVDSATFTLTEIDDVTNSHWAYVANLDYAPGGSDIDLDILISSEDTFAWYENIAAGVQFAAYGELESSILEKDEALSWLSLDWIGSRPAGTTCNFYVRSGDDAGSIQSTAWQGPFQIPTGQANGQFDISSVTTAGHHYFQYKIEMGCGTANQSPVLYDVAVEYEVEPGTGHDVGTLQILQPIDTIIPGAVVTPTAIFKNFGGYDENFLVFFQIGCVYSDFKLISLAAGQTVTISFDPWVAILGYYSEGASTYLETDENPDNDTVSGWVTVTKTDFRKASTHDEPVVSFFALFKPMPNPVINNLSISYALPEPSDVVISIFDVDGRVVKNLISETRTAGYYHLNADCQKLGSGVYILKMKAGKFAAIEKFVVTK